MFTFVLPDRMLTATLATQGWFMPPGPSNHAPHVDWAMNFINGVTVVFFVAIIAAMLLLIIKYRRTDPHQQAASQLSHSTALEMSWTIPPVFIVGYIFWLGFSGFMEFSNVPNKTYDITVTGQKWAWNFTHAHNHVVDEHLHIPAGEPVKLTLKSNDVIHSVFIPAFRVKKDAVPGRYTTLWFQTDQVTPHAQELDNLVAAQRAETDKAKKAELARQIEAVAKKAQDAGHILYCTEFCGTSHSMMARRVIVHPPGWRAPDFDPTTLEPAVWGKMLFSLKACNGCHQIVKGGPELPGPSFADGIYGKDEKVGPGGSQTVKVDDAYLAESIKNPTAKIVFNAKTGQPYPPVMPLLPVSDQEVAALIEYMKTLGK